MLDPNATIFCDMDGVLADFFTGARQLITRAHNAIPQEWSSSRSIAPALEWIEENLGANYLPETRADLEIPAVRKLVLSAINFAPGDFFASLPPLPDGLDLLWPTLRQTNHPVVLLSAPIGVRKGSRAKTAEEGKREWAAQWLSPIPPLIMSPSRRKHEHARTGGYASILIDDRQRTIQQWRASGGIGIHHIPGHSAQTVAQLSGLLRQ
ncbi:MAG: hypothetical protein ACI8RZ_004723 [Myxococcota bacterium]|jgi:hypothetical protein